MQGPCTPVSYIPVWGKDQKTTTSSKKVQDVVSAMKGVSHLSQVIAEEGNLLTTSGKVTIGIGQYNRYRISININ